MLPEYLKTDQKVTDNLQSFLESTDYSKIGVLVDENTEALCYPLIKSKLPDHTVFLIDSGESQKTLETCQNIWDGLTSNGFDRHSLLINLGGGVIGDMGGFCAATFKRGMDFINIPTTLLSQVDASIGGKLGIDYSGYKNHIGVFADPTRVIIDDIFLNTLPEKELLSGYAEVIKHSLIADPDHWQELKEKHVSEIKWKPVIERSLRVKSEIVRKDPFESGLRKVLNFGHTLGHAVESQFLDSDIPLLHGEAIAIGMIMESWLSVRSCGFPESDASAVMNYIIQTYGHREIGRQSYEEIYRRSLQDKKNKGGKVQSILLKNVGDPLEQELEKDQIIQAIEFYDNIRENV